MDSCFFFPQVYPIKGTAAINVLLHISWYMCLRISLRYTPRGRIARMSITCMFNFTLACLILNWSYDLHPTDRRYESLLPPSLVTLDFCKISSLVHILIISSNIFSSYSVPLFLFAVIDSSLRHSSWL